MRKLFYIIMCLPLLAACTATVPQAEYDRMKQMHDSLAEVAESMDFVITTVSTAMDDMAAEEGMIFIDDEGNDLKDKSAVLSHLKAFRDHMAQQRQQIADLQKQLASGSSNSGKLQKLIDNLNQQIIQKDLQIAELEKNVEKKNVTIADLKNQLEAMTQARAAAEQARDYFQEVARFQDGVINTVYYVIGTKKELKELGLTEGVFKKKANYANFDYEKFTQADMRELTMINILSPNPKLITEKPESSYTLIKNGDNATLTITDPAKFWDGSPYLVIQL